MSATRKLRIRVDPRVGAHGPKRFCRRCRVKAVQSGTDGLCLRCARLEAGQPVSPGADGPAPQVLATLGLRGEAVDSWWLDCDRAAFDARLAEELPRMQRSRIAHHLRPEALEA